jgi:amino acid permease
MATIEPTNAIGYSTDRPAMTEKGQTVRHLVEADLLDERYETTKRGLKSRHVQLMALGGTIGTGKTPLPCTFEVMETINQYKR